MSTKITKQIYPSEKGDITVYTLTNASGAQVELSTLGAGIVAVRVPDRDGRIDNVVLGYAFPADYFYDGPCAGKIPGRFANRIAAGRFVLDGVGYQLAINNGPNALHGGPDGFQNRIWDSREESGGRIVFFRVSPDGEEHYPGTLAVTAEYSWSDDNRLSLRMTATTDKTTVINLTNHAYFNLKGENSGSVLGHKLRLACDEFLPTDSTLIPTGQFMAVKDTPMDFTRPKLIGADIKAEFPALEYGKGYDNCWVVADWHKGEKKIVAELTDEESGRTLEVATTQPGVQVYTGNWLSGCPSNPEGRSYDDYDGVAIECCHFPDSPNKPEFPSTKLHPDEKFEELIEFHFKTI